MKESLIRTTVPLIVGLIVTGALRLGVKIDEASVTVIVTSRTLGSASSAAISA